MYGDSVLLPDADFDLSRGPVIDFGVSMRDMRCFNPFAVAIFCLLLATPLANADLSGAGKAPLVQSNTTVKIGEGVYVIPDQRVNLVPNVGIILGERGILVVDTGMGPTNARTILREVRKISDKPVLYLTITHFHPEHGMGAQAFPPETAIVYPLAQKQELFEKGENFIKMFSGFSPEIADLLKPVKIVPPSIAFSKRVELDLGGTAVELFHLGSAHTRGDNFVFLPAQKILFAGDVVVNRFFPIMPDQDSDGENWIRILDKLQELSPAKVVPGHGEIGDATLIVRMKKFLSSLRSRIRDLSGQGKSEAEIESILTPEFRAKYRDWGNPEWLKSAIQNFYSRFRAR